LTLEQLINKETEFRTVFPNVLGLEVRTCDDRIYHRLHKIHPPFREPLHCLWVLSLGLLY
jgi:hypothetical protein